MVRRWLYAAAALAGLVLWTWPVSGWFDLPENYLQAAICYLNDVDVSPIASGTIGWSNATLDAYSASHVAYWTMEEDAAADRVDGRGSNDLTAYDAPSRRAGKDGFALDLDGAADYLDRTDTAALSPTTSMVLAAWVYLDALAANSVVAIKTGSYEFFVTSAGNLTFRVYEGDSDQKAAAVSGVTTAAWHHLAGIAAGNATYVYLDGAETSGDAYDGTIKDAASNLTLGQNGGASLWLNGAIDAVSIWKGITFADAPARQAFITALYNGGTGRFYAAGAVTAAEAGTVSPSVTVRVQIAAESAAIEQAYLQYEDTGGTWHDLVIKWHTGVGNVTYTPEIAFTHPQVSFGHDRFGVAHVPAGNSTLLRLYVSDGTYESLDTGADSDAEGALGNGTDWQVVSATFHATDLKPGRPALNLTAKPPPDQP